MSSQLNAIIVSKVSDYIFAQVDEWMDEQEIDSQDVKEIMQTVKQTVEARFQ